MAFIFVETQTPVHWRPGHILPPGILCTPIRAVGFPNTPQWQAVVNEVFNLPSGMYETLGQSKFIGTVDPPEMYRHVFETSSDIKASEKLKTMRGKKKPVGPNHPSVTGHGAGCQCPNCLLTSGGKPQPQQPKSAQGHSLGCNCQACKKARGE